MYLYINKSLKENTYYVGISDNPGNRLKAHNNGKVKSTKLKRPWVTIYIEKYENIKEARKREKYLKSYKGVKEKREIINKYLKKNNSGIV